MHVGEVQIDGGNCSQRFISRTEGSLPVLKGWSVVNSLFLWIFMSSQLNWISRIAPDLFYRTQYGAQPEFEPTLHRPQNRRSDEHSPDTVTNHCGSVHLAFRWESGRCLKSIRSSHAVKAAVHFLSKPSAVMFERD
jgi:hypothetical protein